jgi:hypothetical protein
MSGDQSLECVGAEAPSIRTGENGIGGGAALLRQPFLENRGDVRAQWRAPHLSAFSEATDVGARAELYILMAK